MADKHANVNSDKKRKHLDILNTYKLLNLYQISNIMFRVKPSSSPSR